MNMTQMLMSKSRNLRVPLDLALCPDVSVPLDQATLLPSSFSTFVEWFRIRNESLFCVFLEQKSETRRIGSFAD